MQSNFSLTKWSLIFLVTIFSNLVLSQTAEEFKRTKKLRIEKETDSLILIRDQKNKELEKIELDNLNQTSQLREKLKYDEIKQNQKNVDSSINVHNFRIDSLKLYTNRDILLDSLFKDQKIKITNSSLALTLPISMLTKETIEENFKKPAGNLSEKIKDEFINLELKQINELEKETIPQEKFLKNGILFKIKGDYNQRTKLFDKMGIETDTEKPCVLINKDEYNNLRGSGARLGNPDDLKKSDKIKDDEFVVVQLKYNIYDPIKAVAEITDKLQLVSEGLPIYLNLNYNYKYINCGTPISEKKLNKIKEGLKSNEIEFFNKNQQKDFWRNYFRECYLVKNYQNSVLLNTTFVSKLNELKTQKNLVDKKMNEIKDEISTTDSKNNLKVKKLKYEIDLLNNSINQKDDKIKKMIDDEDRRITLIIDGDKNLEQKNYEQAISKYESAINIRNSDDIQVKLKKSKDLYAPILAVKKEEERLAKVERDRLAAQDAEKLQTENSTWHSENVFREWLIAFPFYNYEKTVKLEFKMEDGIVAIYVNEKWEGVVENLKLYGNPHNTFIDIFWYRAGKEGSIRVFSNFEGMKKNLKGTISGISGIKNGSSLRREGVSWN